MHTYTPEAAQAIESSSRQFTHRLMIDWKNDGSWSHALTDMSRFVTSTTRDQALSSTAPEEVMLIEGNAAAALEIEVAGKYNNLPLTGHFAPYNGRSIFYSSGIDSVIGADMYYDIAVWTDAGWEWYRQFTGVVREIEAVRETGVVKISCLDNVEKMRNPVRIPPYALYKDYLINGYKRAGLVDSSSVIDLCARVGGFSMGPRGWDDYHLQDYVSDANYSGYRDALILKVPFHGSVLPEIGSLDNEFEFHLTEAWENDASSAVRAKAEQYIPGPHGYLALNAVPQGKETWAVKKYWPEYDQAYFDDDPFGTFVLGTWIYWPGINQAASASIIEVDTQLTKLQLIVEASNGGVNGRIVSKSPEPDVLFDGNWLTLPSVGWHYIEANFRLGWGAGASSQIRTCIDSTLSATKTVSYTQAGVSDYALNLLTTVRNVYALSDLVIYRAYHDRTDPAYKYDLTLYDNAVYSEDWGRNRITYTLRDSTQEAWEVAKDVAAAEYGVVFFDDLGKFNFWNYTDVQKRQGTIVRSFDLNSVEGLSVRTTLDSVRNVWKATTKTGYCEFGYIYDLGKDGVPYWKDVDGQFYPLEFLAQPLQWMWGWIADKPTTVSTHPYLTKLVEFAEFDETGPYEGYKPYRFINNVNDYIGDVDYALEAYPRKASRDWSQLRIWNPNSEVEGFIGPNDIKRFRIAGTTIREEEDRTWQVTDADSRAKYGDRILELKGNFWLQDRFQTELMLEAIVSKLGRPIPVTDNITVAGDPRIQIGDTIEINDWEGMGERIWLQVYGIRRTLEDGSGLTDTYQVEVIKPPGQWILGSSSYSILGQSTILS